VLHVVQTVADPGRVSRQIPGRIADRLRHQRRSPPSRFTTIRILCEADSETIWLNERAIDAAPVGRN